MPSKKSVVEETVERPTVGVLRSMHMLSIVFLLGAVAAVVAWFVYVAKYNINFYRKVRDNEVPGLNTVDQVTVTDPATGLTTGPFTDSVIPMDQATICFQALVVSVLFYFALRYHYTD